MVKVMIQTLEKKKKKGVKDVIKILREHFTEEELKEILPL